jgi:hypothetical protein
VLSTRRDVEPSDSRTVAATLARLREPLSPEAVGGLGKPGVRLGLFGNNPDGLRCTCDTAL